MLAITTVAILVAMLLAIIRALMGPTLYDRVLAVNACGTIAVLLISVFCFLIGRQGFLDIALLYALINFITTIAVLRFFEYGDLSSRPANEDSEV